MTELDWNLVEKIIFERRSVRWYKSDQVPEHLVHRILETGRFAPSAGNSQPWKFIVIRDKAILEEMERDVQKICRLFRFFLDWRRPGLMGMLGWIFSQILIRLQPHELHPIPMGAIFLIAEGKLKLFHGAPTVILILKDNRGVSNPDLDCGICGQNMVLTAHSLGLSTCWVNFVTALMKPVTMLMNPLTYFTWKNRLKIGYPYELVTSIAMGYARGNPNKMVERELHEIAWYENGRRTVSGGDHSGSGMGISDRFIIPTYDNEAYAHTGRVKIDMEKCNGCGMCVTICPGKALRIEGHGKEKKAHMELVFPQCMSCNDCAAMCDRGAITVSMTYDFGYRFKMLDRSEMKPPRRFSEKAGE